VYDVIGPNDKDKYVALLTSRDVLNEHPDIFIRGVLRLKPFRTGLAQPFHWVADEDDEGVGAGPRGSFVEGVYTGTGPEGEQDSDDEDDSMDVSIDAER